ncbi:MAG: NINE protein [Candidatus Parcubacteria bacterium]|nr:NINE protein [Candidatus Parcubacteria bacterium]
MKNKTTAALLALFLGGIGVHKFYLGKNGQGLVYLLFCWTFIPSVLGFIEAIMLFSMTEEVFNKTYNLASTEKSGLKKCPFCAELVQKEALKCKHCGSVLSEIKAESKNSEENGEETIAEETTGTPFASYVKVILFWVVILVILGTLLRNL